MSKTIDEIHSLALRVATQARYDTNNYGGVLPETVDNIAKHIADTLEALLLGEDAPEDISSKDVNCPDECAWRKTNETNATWRQHIRNRLGSKS